MSLPLSSDSFDFRNRDTEGYRSKWQNAISEMNVCVLYVAIWPCDYPHLTVICSHKKKTTEYQKKYDDLSRRFDDAEAKLELVKAQIADKVTRRATIEDFLAELRSMDAPSRNLTPDYSADWWIFTQCTARTMSG